MTPAAMVHVPLVAVVQFEERSLVANVSAKTKQVVEPQQTQPGEKAIANRQKKIIQNIT
ncbi:MAG TPA: hypothetical protein VGG64_29850 [Pirellulales bacterium]